MTTNKSTLKLVVATALALSLLAGLATSADALNRTQVKSLVVEEAHNSNVPPSLVMAVAKVESDFQEGVVSTAGARGVMQIMPATARGEFGVAADELWDARLNVQLGIHYLEQLIERYGGRWDLALSHYNGGTLKGTGASATPHSYTRKYVADVLRWEKRYAQQSKVWRTAKASDQDGWQPARTAVSNTEAVTAVSDAGSEEIHGVEHEPEVSTKEVRTLVVRRGRPVLEIGAEKVDRDERRLILPSRLQDNPNALDDFDSGRVSRLLDRNRYWRD